MIAWFGHICTLENVSMVLHACTWCMCYSHETCTCSCWPFLLSQRSRFMSESIGDASSLWVIKKKDPDLYKSCVNVHVYHCYYVSCHYSLPSFHKLLMLFAGLLVANTLPMEQLMVCGTPLGVEVCTRDTPMRVELESHCGIPGDMALNLESSYSLLTWKAMSVLLIMSIQMIAATNQAQTTVL